MLKVIEKINDAILERGFDWFKINEFGMKNDKNGIYYYVKYDAGNECKSVCNAIVKIYVEVM